MKRHIVILLALLVFTTQISAQQRDARGRVVETVIADGLASLPAKTSKAYNQVIGELAETGQTGIETLVGMMVPAGQGKNAAYEYAINGIVNYVSDASKSNLRDAVRKGLVSSIGKVQDKDNKAFLVSQLQKIATKDEAPLFQDLLKDSYLQPYAASALAQTPGTDDVVLSMMQQESAPRTLLAKLATAKGLSGPAVEGILQSWTKTSDAKTLPAVYSALASCGSVKSLPILAAAAKNAGYLNDAAGATDSYLRLLDKLSGTEPETVVKAAKALLGNGNSAVRCAGLRLLLQNAGSKSSKEILKALKDPDIQYRNTALGLAQSVAGDGIFSTVAGKFSSFPTSAKTDIVRWLGNNKAASAIDAVTSAFSSSDNALATAAIAAAGKIGGQKALNALIGQLGGPNADAAAAALRAFNGDITPGVTSALADSDAPTVVQALKLASDRRIASAYPTVKSLLSSPDSNVKNAAYDALKGVVRSNDFDAVCDLLENSDASNRSALQAAAMSAIQGKTSDEQYRLVSGRLSKTSNASLYYPLLAQAGNSASISRLVKAYKNASTGTDAFKSLLHVNNIEAVPALFDIAENNASQKDAALRRVLTLVKGSSKNAVQKYQLYRKALDLVPSKDVQNSYLSALSGTKNLPALMLASKYLDKNDNAFSAATAVKDIVAKTADLQKGATVKQALTKAQDVFRAQTNNADAGYAVDEISGLLPKLAAKGFEKKADNATATAKKAYTLANKYENFELYMDWKSDDAATLNVRSMPELALDPANGVKYLYNPDGKQADAATVNGANEWNTLYVKAVDDRITVTSNGVKVADNLVLKNASDKDINFSGLISLVANGQNTVQVRDVYVNELPATPIYQLSAEEKKQGFEVLFDGRSLDKWQGNMVNYMPQEGTIYVNASYGNNGNLYTKKEYGDFVYRFEFCFLEPGVNNGVGVRTQMGVDAAYEGMEIQILDHDAPIYKGLRDYQQHGSVYGIIVPKHVKFGKLGTWNTEEIRAEGDHITVTVNGEVILDGNIREACQGHNVAPDGSKNNPYTVDRHNHPGLFNKKGLISFCGHGEGVKFRNIRILDLSKQKSAKK